MTDTLLKTFSIDALSSNSSQLKIMVQRIRRKEGVGSSDDELTIYRAIADTDIFLEIVTSMQQSYDTLKNALEKKIEDREERIKELLSGDK